MLLRVSEICRLKTLACFVCSGFVHFFVGGRTFHFQPIHGGYGRLVLPLVSFRSDFEDVCEVEQCSGIILC